MKLVAAGCIILSKESEVGIKVNSNNIIKYKI